MRFPGLRSLTSSFHGERDRFALWVPVLLAAGIGWYFALDREPPLIASAALAVFFAALAWQLRHHLVPRIICLSCLIVAAGFLAAGIRTQIVATPVIYGELFYRDVEGRIGDIQQREKGQRLVLTELSIERLPARRTPVRVSVTLKKEAPDLQIGDRIRLKATLFAPPGPAMPGAYDFTRALYFDRIGAVGYAISAPEMISREETHGFSEWLDALRLRLADRITRPMAADNGPVAAALMVGEQSGVTREVGDAMRDAGLYHVLSISGLHMSLAVALLYVTIRLLLSLYPPLALRLPVKKIAAALGLLGALAYLLLAGYPVPAVRSFVMVACVMVAVLADRRGISLYSLAWAASLILLVQPESLLGASFHLSFAATLAIIAFYERYGYLVHQAHAGVVRKLWLYFLGLTATSLVATLATTPLVIYHFSRFTAWGIVANTLMVPLASFWIMPAAVLSFIAMPLGLERWPLAWLEYGISLMIDGSKWVAGFPHAAFALPPPSFAGILLVICGGLWLTLWRRKWHLLGIPLMLLGMATMGFHRPYDILVSDDGSKVAVRSGDNFVFVKGRPASFDGQFWLRWHGSENGLLRTHASGEMPMLCDAAKCVVEIAGRRMSVGLRKKETEGLCNEDMAIVVSGDRLGGAACEAVKLLIDRTYLQTNGAVGIRFTGEAMEVETANSYRGDRPWIVRRPPRKLDALPFAQSGYDASP
jgi:competence protein ComEC